MLICHCKGKSHRDVQGAVALGARNLADLHRICGAGGACGGCRPTLQALLHGRHEDRATVTELRPTR
ncbi:MAG: (2Fe-2S)-binding protein [Planctomycetes bacterium]|nr:(2Fe-2S)-binding protein [Planctomycetota bacterium]